MVWTSTMLGKELKADLKAYLIENKESFAWNHGKMTSIVQEVITCKINANS